ncbi:MAG: HK97 family phage prohead protease [Rhodospirillales bacterium]|nr:HK97 family phage prohead protease [Rhodospirillales bacterium]
MTPERRYAELRQDGRRLIGTAIRYGEIAELPFGFERFEPGAFQPLGDAMLNVQHDRGRPLARTGGGGLRLVDDSASLRIEAALPKTREADDALELVKAGVFRGLSIEFHATAERMDGNVRVVQRAELSGVAVVDSGAYPGSVVEARKRGDRGGRLASYRGRIPAGKRLECRCGPDGCDEALFESGALDGTIPKDQQRDVLAVAGDYANAIGSRKRKSLRFWSDGKGGLNFAVDVPNTERGRALMDTLNTVDVIGRPVIDQAASAFVREGALARYSSVRVRAITIGATDAAQGWAPLTALKAGDPGYDIDAVPDAPARRRAKVWL